MRGLAGLALVIAAVLDGAVAVAGCAIRTAADVNTVGMRQSDQEPRIPSVQEPRVDAAGREVFDLNLQSGRAEHASGSREARLIGRSERSIDGRSHAGDAVGRNQGHQR